jgi:hypothetical protein
MADTPAAAPHPNLFREFLHAVAGMLPGLGSVARAELAAAIDQHADEHDGLVAAAAAAVAAADPVPAPAPEGTQP